MVLTGFGGLTFHAQFVTDDGAVILMHYTGLVEQTEHFESAAGANEPTNWPINTCGRRFGSRLAPNSTPG